MKRTLTILLLVVFSMTISSCTKSIQRGTLRYSVPYFEETYHPYYYNSKMEEDIIGLFSLRLFPIDKNGEILLNSLSDNGEVGTDNKTYYGATTLEKVELDDGSFKYTLTLRDDVKSGDGKSDLTYRDLLFDFYYLSDPSYDGNSLFYTLPIKGINEYRNGVTECLNIQDSYLRQEALDNCYIEGIKYENEKVSIIFERDLTKEELKIFNIFIVPLYHYGNTKVFNIRGNRFGFTKGSTSKIKVAKGYGMYNIIDVSPQHLTLSKNNVYFHPEKKYISQIKFILEEEKTYDDDGYRISGGDPFYLIDIGEIDIAIIELTDENLDEIKRYNINNKLNGHVISLIEFEGEDYGYIYSTKRLEKERIGVNSYNSNFSIFNDLEAIKRK